jgi:putative glutamine amidotransferase
VASKGSNVTSQARPVIGLTTYLEQAKTGVWDVQAAFLPKIYFEAVNLAGGIAVLLPPQPIDASIANRILDGLDGLIICGGKDVDAARYGQQAHPLNDEPRPDRDALEDELLSAAIVRGIPFLGICRGAQMLNVNRGGTLIQHLPDVINSDRYQKGNADFTSVEVAVTQGSLLARVLGSADAVAGDMYHHQAIDELGEGLSVVGTTSDGVIEAIQLDGVPFGLAVQWHPEQRHDDIRLFKGLVSAAKTYAARTYALTSRNGSPS